MLLVELLVVVVAEVRAEQLTVLVADDYRAAFPRQPQHVLVAV